MWIATTHGFFSITQSPTHPGNLQIRARCKHDLEMLKEVFGIGARIVETPPPADYRWRIVVNAETVAAVLMGEVMKIDYKNFKNAVHDTPGQENKSGPYLRVWHAMQSIQGDPAGPDLFRHDEFIHGHAGELQRELNADALDNPKRRPDPEAGLPPHAEAGSMASKRLIHRAKAPTKRKKLYGVDDFTKAAQKGGAK